MKLTKVVAPFSLLLVCVAALVANGQKPASATVKGYVLDSACAFTKALDKPISREWAISCAKAGSRLDMLAEDGTICCPIADTTPSTGQNSKLLPVPGPTARAPGSGNEPGGSQA